MNNTEKQNIVFEAIKKERDNQDNKHGTIIDHQHNVAEWILIMENELNKAKQGWCNYDENKALDEILQVIATGVACLEQHGIVERNIK